jgi:NADH:ubiquinone oxidoreductase subunit F (NADH-binding)
VSQKVPAGRPVTAAAPDPGRLPRLLATAAGPGLDAHFRRWGPMPGGAPSLIGEVERAGLRGRGGAGFPTATKLRAVAAAGGRAVVVVNGTEGEPASRKDKALLIGSPHLVLDGASIAGETVGAHQAIICIDEAATTAINSVTAALAERHRVDADRVSFRVEAAPTGYVTGEESALVRWLNGGDAKPTFGAPRPFERGVQGRPTLVNNVETLAHLALIARFGAGWYRGLGHPHAPGTILVTFTGDIARPGVYEFPAGIALADALRAAGALGDANAVLVGGYFGVWIPGHAVPHLNLDASSLGRVGASLGCGAIAVLGPDSCGLRETASITAWLAGQSARQCGPCLNGLPAIADAVDALVAGDRGRQWEKQVRRWLDQVEGRGACRHPDGAVHFVRSALSVFATEIDQHRRHGPCRARPTVLPVPDFDASWR